MGFFVFVNCHICHGRYRGKTGKRTQNEREAVLVTMEAWPKNAEGRPLAAHVVTAGDFNKGAYTDGKLFNAAVVREGLPIKPFDLPKGTCPITGAASWEMPSPPIRFDRSAWTIKMEEHEILGIPRPSAGTTKGWLICAPMNDQGQLQIGEPTWAEIADTAQQCKTACGEGNVEMQGPVLFGTLSKEEEVLPAQAKADGVILDGNINRFPAFHEWNSATACTQWHTTKNNGLGCTKADAKNCLYAFINDDEMHKVEYDVRLHLFFNMMAFLSNAEGGTGGGDIRKKGVPIQKCHIEGLWIKEPNHKAWFQAGFVLTYQDNSALLITIGKNISYTHGILAQWREKSDSAVATMGNQNGPGDLRNKQRLPLPLGDQVRSEARRFL